MHSLALGMLTGKDCPQTLLPWQTLGVRMHVTCSMEAGCVLPFGSPVPVREAACTKYCGAKAPLVTPLSRLGISVAGAESWPPFRSQFPAREDAPSPTSPPGSTRPGSDPLSAPLPPLAPPCHRPALLILCPKGVHGVKCLEQCLGKGKTP